MLAILLSLIFPIVLVLAMLSDLRRFIIPNALSIVLAASYPLVAWLAGLTMQTILLNLALGAGLLVAGIILFMLRVFGGGDAKLIAAVGIWTGTEGLLPFLAYMAMIGGALALALLLFRRAELTESLGRWPWLRQLHQRRHEVPYAVAIGLAGLLVYTKLPPVAAITGQTLATGL